MSLGFSKLIWKNENPDFTFAQFFERLLIKKGRGIGPMTP
jgi:hypothetical protein